jgi:hypothetical protein
MTMKKNQKITALSAILLLLAGGSTSCNKEAYNYVDCSQFTSMNCESFFDIVHDPTASIIGKWQLVKSYSNWNNTDPRCIDHCHEKNVLMFKKMGK